jgi:Flp pilus assembly protein TadG
MAGSRRRPDDAGTVTTELVLVMPLLIAFLLFVLLAGYLVDAKSDIVGAAADAARAASLQNSAAAAQTQAQAAAQATVADEGIDCAGGPQVTVGINTPAFGPGTIVHVHVECTVDAGDLTFIGIIGNPVLKEDAWEQVDLHRSF